MTIVSKSNEKSIPISVTYKGKRVIAGNLTPDGIFLKTVERRDKLLVLDAFGFDISYMRDVFAQGCNYIKLRVKDTGERYSIDVDTFKKNAVTRSIGKFGPRLYCPLKYWIRTDQKPKKAETQMRFFGT